MPHAVARLRSERLAKSLKPFVARGSRTSRCERCRVPFSHCLCPWLPTIESDCGVCLLMHDIEPLKPSNTGWLIADVVRDTFAFTWQRTGVDPRLLALLADPQWQPLVIFPGEYAESRRVVTTGSGTMCVKPTSGRNSCFLPARNNASDSFKLCMK